MATMFRVTLPDGGPATVSAGVAAFSTCLAAEVAVIVGDTVARQRCGSELRETLKRIVIVPRDPDAAVGAGNVKTFVAAPGAQPEAIAAATVAEIGAPDEALWGLVFGATAAQYLDRTNVLLAALERAFNAFPATLGL